MQIISAHEHGLAAEEWDDFVQSREDSTFCHLYAWSTVLARTMGHRCTYLAAVDQGAVQGVLPLVRVRSPLFGHYLVSVPFLNYGGPIGSPEAVRALCEAAVELARGSAADLLELRSRSEIGAEPLTTNPRKITVLLDLPSDSEVLWNDGLKAKVRSQVRRPRKEGMVARFGAAEVESFYQVFARGMRDLGTPVLGKGFFAQILAALGERVEFGAVYLDDVPVAVGCGFTWKDEFEITWAAALSEYNRMAPNMLLYWSFMELMIERGVKVFNFGRCTPGGGTHRFKSQWGPTRDVVLPWAQWSPSGVAATPNPDGGKLFHYATEIWSRLPLAITNRIGPLLARSLP
jgi:serine/alanine adding enzyme